ncbi:DUF2062 domain-containing protein [Rhodovulum adriaticum]|uniref:DUF2062 domain-containing protein n=1 Tax=Rhodovulum adriaticum TaxID=35804 RepID=A0A4V2SMI6_RHOAD|nr:DUF2062 domain-containing protein [Rhodovulum adriaticum]MBK1634945.1 DNA-directed RNA polymerase subunit omega [Rhodovulum adriaticum]TCP27416.1 hypothetical protein EV656_101322 [Rhodovulum adriaticum]
MVFRRRDKRSIGRIVLDGLYPRGGWGRALYYITHRVRRLPDTPHKIARGIFAGLFVTFTPFYGLHFVLAALLARLMHGNIVAALLATLFGNPLTYVPIGVVALKTGHFILGTEFDEATDTTLVDKFAGAAADLKDNAIALFTDDRANWAQLSQFYNEVFLPYLVGGIVPGIAAGLAGYYLTLPVITAYQNRRRVRLKQKLAGLGKSPAQPKDRP